MKQLLTKHRNKVYNLLCINALRFLYLIISSGTLLGIAKY